MSDLATQAEQSGFEPDEETLISALRNQDDIPILMDVVTEQLSVNLSQADHLQHTLSDHPAELEVTASAAKVEAVENAATGNEPTAAQISQAVESVLQKRLPELISEVLQALNSQSAK
ncbi:hypothetical protein [Marinomonas sp.]